MKRVFVYSFGAAEGLLLDRVNPHWKEQYFKHLLTTDPLFILENRSSTSLTSDATPPQD